MTEETQQLMHPVYGVYTLGPKPIPGYPGATIDETLNVVQNGRRKTRFPAVRLYDSERKHHSIQITHLLLLSFFPHIERQATIDHIDEIYTNNALCNLQWMTRAENTSKSVRLRPRNSGVAMQKMVLEYGLVDGRVEPVDLHDSTRAAAETTGLTFDMVNYSVRRHARFGVQTRFCYSEQPNLHGETWTTSPALDVLLDQVDVEDSQKVKASSHGRVTTINGIKTVGNCLRGNKCRQIRIWNNVFYVHQIVFAAFQNTAPPKRGARDSDGRTLVICHSDDAPLDGQGCYRNWACDLRLDTQNNNILESAAHKRKRNGEAPVE